VTVAEESKSESRPFEADVAKLLHLMVHSVYSDKSVFLRELIANAADACERLRYEALSEPALLGDGDDAKPRITVTLDPAKHELAIEDNGIGMSRDEMIEALGTIARSGTKAFLERIEVENSDGESALIGRFGVGFYSAFMVADRVEVISRRAGTDAPFVWSSDGKGTFAVSPAGANAPRRGTRVVLHVMDDAKTYAERATVEQLIRAQSGHVPVPIAIIDRPGAPASEITDGAALWMKPKAEISAADYNDFYRSIGGLFDEPALIVHFRAEGRQDYTTLLFVPGSRPFDLFDPDRSGRIKLYVKRVFIADDAEILPRYLRFVRGLVDSADLPLNVSREKIQESPLLATIRKNVTSRVLAEFERLADKEPQTYAKIWDTFGAVLKEGIYEDFERRDALLKLARFKTTAFAEGWRSLKDYATALKANQTAIYYLAGDDIERLRSSPHLEGFSARGIEVLLLPDPVDTFWVMPDVGFDGKPFKSVTQGAADLALIAPLEAAQPAAPDIAAETRDFLAFVKSTLGDAVVEVRASDRLTGSPVCLVAPESGPDRALERLLAGAGRLKSASKPILEVNPRHALVIALAALGEGERAFKEDAAHLLFDEARLLDGERPADARQFSDRLARVLERGLRHASS
jgi:molecular chaperone HtpG